MKHIKPLTRPVRPHNAPARSTEHGRPAHRSSGVTRRATALNDALPRFGEEEWASVVVYRALRRIAAGSVPAWCRDDAIQRAALRLTTASLPRLARVVRDIRGDALRPSSLLSYLVATIEALVMRHHALAHRFLRFVST